MRTIITLALCLSLFSVSYSQDKKKETVKIEQLPEVVISHTKKYVPDNNPDAAVRKTQNEFIAYNVEDEYKNFDEYLVTLQSRKGSLVATYNQKGVLTNVTEKYVNVELPREIIKSVCILYPEWTIAKSKFEYSQKEGQIFKKAYYLKLKKDNKTQNVLISSTGEVVKINDELAMN